eukprot:210879-Amphidinium_carterae.2
MSMNCKRVRKGASAVQACESNSLRYQKLQKGLTRKQGYGPRTLRTVATLKALAQSPIAMIGDLVLILRSYRFKRFSKRITHYHDYLPQCSNKHECEFLCSQCYGLATHVFSAVKQTMTWNVSRVRGEKGTRAYFSSTEARFGTLTSYLASVDMLAASAKPPPALSPHMNTSAALHG